MKLNKKQKDIIKNISERKITDILSFVKHYNLGKEVCYDKLEVQSKFDAIYEGKVFKCDSVHFDNFNEEGRIVQRIDKRTALCKPKLRFIDPYYHCSCYNIENTYHLFKPVYITECMHEIVSFIALWRYLQEQMLIIELPKSCTDDDMALFLEQKKEKAYNYQPLIDNNVTPYAASDLDISFNNFFNKGYKLNSENFEICLPYLTKKIYPSPDLNNFIQNGFNTTEEINNRRNLRIAFAGVVIAIGTSVASMYMSAQDEGYHSELNSINKSLQEIKEEMSTEETETEETSIEESTIKEEITTNQIE